MRTYVRVVQGVSRCGLLVGDPEPQRHGSRGCSLEIQATTKQPIALDFVIALVHLCGEKRDRRYGLAALRYIARYVEEAKPSLLDVAGSPLSWRIEWRTDTRRSSVRVVR